MSSWPTGGDRGGLHVQEAKSGLVERGAYDGLPEIKSVVWEEANGVVSELVE
jgi:hypothetical protein